MPLAPPHLVAETVTIHDRHEDVRDDDVDLLEIENGQAFRSVRGACFVRGRGFIDLESGRAEHLHGEFQFGRMIFYDKDLHSSPRRYPATAPGSVRVSIGFVM